MGSAIKQIWVKGRIRYDVTQDVLVMGVFILVIGLTIGLLLKVLTMALLLTGVSIGEDLILFEAGMRLKGIDAIKPLLKNLH